MVVCLASTSCSVSRLFTIIFLRNISTDRNLLHTTCETLKLQNCPTLLGVYLVKEVLSLGKIGPKGEAYRSPPTSAEFTVPICLHDMYRESYLSLYNLSGRLVQCISSDFNSVVSVIEMGRVYCAVRLNL